MPEALAGWTALDGSVRAPLKKPLARRLDNPHVPGGALHGALAGCYKIKPLKQGVRLVYAVEGQLGNVAIMDQLLTHVVDKRINGRERFGRFIIPTLSNPDEVWTTVYDDDTTRRRFIKLFSGAKYDILVIVREQADGSVLWNVINRDRKGMNALRVGTPVYRRDGE
jgi:hypothetical protein